MVRQQSKSEFASANDEDARTDLMPWCEECAVALQTDGGRVGGVPRLPLCSILLDVVANDVDDEVGTSQAGRATLHTDLGARSTT